MFIQLKNINFETFYHLIGASKVQLIITNFRMLQTIDFLFYAFIPPLLHFFQVLTHMGSYMMISDANGTKPTHFQNNALMLVHYWKIAH